MILRCGLMSLNGGDRGGDGDTLCYQGESLSPVARRELGTLGTQVATSSRRPHATRVQIANGDAGFTNRYSTVPSVPTVPNKYELGSAL